MTPYRAKRVSFSGVRRLVKQCVVGVLLLAPFVLVFGVVYLVLRWLGVV